MHKLSLNIANKRYVRPLRVMNRKRTPFLAHIKCARRKKVGKKYAEALQKYQFSTPTP